MKKLFLAFFLLVNMLFLSGCAQNVQVQQQVEPKEITVCAAASLKEALNEIQRQFEQKENIKITLNLASSGTLQKQIEEGAPADLFISAGKKQMDALENKNLLDKDSRKDLLKNRLVLVASKEYKDKINTITDLVDLDVQISIGEPETVPAGQYAKESLTNMDLWNKLTSKMILAKDVKQVLTYVENGEVAAGIVYASDATLIKDSFSVQEFDESTHSPISYPIATVSDTEDKDSTKKFTDYLMSDEAQSFFKKYGFTLIEK
jgi:molybdate transport system substrate-binding protein